MDSTDDITNSSRVAAIAGLLIDRLAETAAEMDGAHEMPARIEALHGCLEALPSEIRQLVALRYEDNQRPEDFFYCLRRTLQDHHDCIDIRYQDN